MWINILGVRWAEWNLKALRPLNMNIRAGYSKNALRITYGPINVGLKNLKLLTTKPFTHPGDPIITHMQKSRFEWSRFDGSSKVKLNRIKSHNRINKKKNNDTLYILNTHNKYHNINTIGLGIYQRLFNFHALNSFSYTYPHIYSRGRLLLISFSLNSFHDL